MNRIFIYKLAKLSS